MSLWSSLDLYNTNQPSLIEIEHVLRTIRPTRISYIEILQTPFSDKENPDEIAEGTDVRTAMAELESYGRFYCAVIAMRCDAFAEQMTAMMRAHAPDCPFAFLGASIEIGPHEFGGFSVHKAGHEDEVTRTSEFTLSIGGDDPEAVFRRVWEALQKSEEYHQFVREIETKVGPVQTDMLLLT